MTPDQVHAVIPAAGSGERAGGEVPKQYQEINHSSLLQLSIEALARHRLINEITVALAPNDEWFDGLKLDPALTIHRVTGGASRAESVFSALQALLNSGAEGWVLVHDAVRPCVPERDIDALISSGTVAGDGALLAIPCRDTLKRADNHQHVTQTLDRTSVWQAQTPQLFPLKRLHHALGDQLNSGRQPTDEAGVMEAVGASPLLVAGSAMNIKVTWPEDFAMAKAILQSRSKS